MARALIYTPEALADLEAAARWLIQPGSGPRARRTLGTIRADMERLRRHPCLWPVGDHVGVRELPSAGGYRVLYRVYPDTGGNVTAGDVRILRLFGPGQDRATL